MLIQTGKSNQASQQKEIQQSNSLGNSTEIQNKYQMQAYQVNNNQQHHQSVSNLQSSKNELQSSRLNTQFSQQEVQHYYKLLSELDPISNERVGSKLAANFFRSSGLQTETLKRIWLLCDPQNQDYLQRSEFFKGLKLIAFAQNHIDVSEDSLLKNQQVPLPVLAEPALIIKQMQQHHHQNLNQQQNLTNNNNKQSVPHWLQMAKEELTYSSMYIITQSRLSEYESIFSQMQQNGFITGQQAASYFTTQTNIPKSVLSQVWTLSDNLNEGFLDAPRFIISLHLLALYANCNVILSVLPQELLLFRNTYVFGKPFNPQQQQTQQSLPGQTNIVQQLQMPRNRSTSDELCLSPSLMRRNKTQTQTLKSQNEQFDPYNDEQVNANINEPKKDLLDDIINQAESSSSSIIADNIPNRQQIEAFNNEELIQHMTRLLQKDITLCTSIEESQRHLSKQIQDQRLFLNCVIAEKYCENKFLNDVLDNYALLKKKIFDENDYLRDEINKLDTQKNSICSSIREVQEGFRKCLNENIAIKKEFSQKANETLNQISDQVQSLQLQKLETATNPQKAIDNQESLIDVQLKTDLQDEDQNKKATAQGKTGPPASFKNRLANFKNLNKIQ